MGAKAAILNGKLPPPSGFRLSEMGIATQPGGAFPAFRPPLDCEAQSKT
jgi:hypothetical protein